MPERTIDWGGANSPYETYVDRNDNGRAVLLDNGTTVFLEYDEAANSGAGGWIVRDAVDADGNDISNVGQLSSTSVNTEKIGSERHYAGAYDGADADARLTNALSAASDGDVIYLESAVYSSDRTISTSVTLIGTDQFGTGTELDGGTWTLSNNSKIEHVTLRDPSSGNGVEVTTNRCTVTRCTLTGTINVAGNRFIADTIQGTGGTIIFENGNSDGIVDSSTGVTVNDNDGGNTVGDIA